MLSRVKHNDPDNLIQTYSVLQGPTFFLSCWINYARMVLGEIPGKPKPRRPTPFFSEGFSLQTKERRDADDDYICRFYPNRHFHYRPCEFVLHNIQGEKIAAATHNSDGCP